MRRSKNQLDRSRISYSLLLHLQRVEMIIATLITTTATVMKTYP